MFAKIAFVWLKFTIFPLKPAVFLLKPLIERLLSLL